MATRRNRSRLNYEAIVVEKQTVNGKWSMRRQRLLRAEVDHLRRLAPLVTDPREQREILKMADTSEERLHELEKRGMPDDSAAKRTCLTGASYYRLTHRRHPIR